MGGSRGHIIEDSEVAFFGAAIVLRVGLPDVGAPSVLEKIASTSHTYHGVCDSAIPLATATNSGRVQVTSTYEVQGRNVHV